MKMKSILTSLVFTVCTMLSFVSKAQAINMQDSLALVDLYDSTAGAGWTNNTNWLTTAPVKQWYGITVTGDRVTSIKLQDANLIGSIPPSIGNVLQLNYLDLSFNTLSGSIPASIVNLTSLTNIYLQVNQLSGVIPSNIGNLINLTYLNLISNHLTGSIPTSFGNLTKLNRLELTSNMLTGSIPAQMANMTNLFYLDLGGNQLTGSIPTEIGNFPALAYLIVNGNLLSGEIPASIANPNFGLLDLRNNSFTFAGMELVAQTFKPSIAEYSPQAQIRTRKKGTSLSVSAGGTLSNNTYKWYKKGGVGFTKIIGDSTFQPTESGTYYAKITNSVAKNLTLQSNNIKYTVTALNNNIASAANSLQTENKTKPFSIYPNPAKDILNIQTNTSAVFVLITQTGKVLITKNINGNGAMNISGITSGLYFLKNTTTGEVQKVIIAK